MSCKQFCDFDSEARRIVGQTVDEHRRAGDKIDAAIERTARQYSITGRATWSLKYGQPFRVTGDLIERLRRRWWAFQLAKVEEARRWADETERQAVAARIAQQLELPGILDAEMAEGRAGPGHGVAHRTSTETRRLGGGAEADATARGIVRRSEQEVRESQ